MPRVISQNDFDKARDRAHRGDDHDAAIAETLRDWATDPERFTLADGVSRAAVLIEAGENFGYAGDYAEALRLFDEARIDGGPTYVDPRALMAQALYEGGQKDAALELAGALRKEAPTTLSTYLVLGGFFELVDELQASQRWYSMGIRAMDSGNVPGSEAQYESMLIGRARVRGELGLAPDTLDDAATIIIERYGSR
ncbi:tetratricopeptide repeat protein [Humibacter ginsenosidimutans]|uniref:tetratricopeptide repeat protein n=1 Tax=Humibacter ginsenosidimutans TaxID=2599293 RepID=UPI00143DD2C2|nr:tetratricopeptide repeat protein [Humibacter ginsenosidimutans]